MRPYWLIGLALGAILFLACGEGGVSGLKDGDCLNLQSVSNLAGYDEVPCSGPHEAVVLSVKEEAAYSEDERAEIESRMLGKSCPDNTTKTWSWYSRDFDVGPWWLVVVCAQERVP